MRGLTEEETGHVYGGSGWSSWCKPKGKNSYGHKSSHKHKSSYKKSSHKHKSSRGKC